MPQIDVYDLEKNKVDSVDVKSEIFEFPVKDSILHLIVRWQLASKRAGTASTKTRGEVRGGGVKPWKQKNLGRARHGSIRSPLWRKGGVVFGPKPKDWSFSVPKKVRKQALKSALSLMYKNSDIYVIKDFVLPEIKTKQIVTFLEKFGISKGLFVVDKDNENLIKSSRNIKDIKVIKDDGLNVYDLLKFNSLVIAQNSINKIQEGLLN